MRREDIKDLLESIISGTPPDTRYIHHIDVGTGPFLDYFSREVLDCLVLQGGATCRFFEGPYGAGKTHLLNMLFGLGLKKQLLVSQIELSNAASLRNWHTITAYILENLHFMINGKMIKGFPEILAALGGNNQIDDSKLKGKQLSHPGFANAMGKATKAHTLKESQKEMLFRFLRGERVGAMKLREVGIQGVKNPLTQRNAELVLNTVLSGLFALGLSVLLLIDETETALGNTYAAKNQMAANLMRRLVDGCSTGTIVGTAVTFTVLPGFIANCARTYQALGERLLPPRLSGTRLGWRWPVLSIEDISSVNSRQDFLEECAMRFEQLINLGGGTIGGSKDDLRRAGREVIDHNAGISFRRDLIKRFASISLKRMR